MTIRKMKGKKLSKTRLGLLNMERLKRQKGEEEKCPTNNQATANCKRFICKDSQRRKVTKIFLPPLNQSNTTFDHNNFYYSL